MGHSLIQQLKSSFCAGRSILLLDGSGNPVACATVERPEEYFTARAVFQHSVLGHVTFRQVNSPDAALTQVTSDLFYDGSQTARADVEWRVVKSGTNDCSSVGTPFNPTSAPGTGCSTSSHSR